MHIGRKSGGFRQIPIPMPAQIAGANGLLRDEYVRIGGALLSQGTDELALEAPEAVRLGRIVTLAALLKVEEGGTYAVHFVPDHGSEPGMTAEPTGEPHLLVVAGRGCDWH